MARRTDAARNGRKSQEEQAVICSKKCRARCCNYVTIQIQPPNSERDWDEIRWWLIHEGIHVVKDDDGWMAIVHSRCEYLDRNNHCLAYKHRPSTCRNYDAENCEYTGPVPFKVCLTDEQDLEHYLRQRSLQRGRAIARRIRAARRQLPAQGSGERRHPLLLEASRR